MREKMEARLAALRREYAAGETQLRREEQQINCLRETLISGAILVLEDLLSSATDSSPMDFRDTRPADDLAVVGTQADP